MFRKVTFIIALLALTAFGPGSAGANLITFDTMPVGNIDGVHIGPASPHGVTITSADGSTSVIYSDVLGFGFATWPNTVSNNNFLVYNPMTFTFDVPRRFVAFVGGDAGNDQDRFTVKLYDQNNTLFYNLDTGVFGGNPLSPMNYMVDQYQFIYNGPKFVKYMVVEAFSVEGGAGILIDNLEYCVPAPLPGTLLLLGSGILGLVGLRFRKA